MTQKTKNIITGCAVAATVILITTLCLATFNYNGSDECKAAVIEIEGETDNRYITEKEVLQHLNNCRLNPVGKIFDSINCRTIEQAVLTYEPVRTAECYKTSKGEIHIRITERQPLVRIITAAESYFIDTDRRRMSILPNIRQKILTAEGSIGENTAKTQIADFAEWLQTNDYWRERIKKMTVRSDRNITLYQFNSDTRIMLGKLTDYKRKLKRLRLFLQASDEMQIKSYKELDVSIDGQVIGRN